MLDDTLKPLHLKLVLTRLDDNNLPETDSEKNRQYQFEADDPLPRNQSKVVAVDQL